MSRMSPWSSTTMIRRHGRVGSNTGRRVMHLAYRQMPVAKLRGEAISLCEIVAISHVVAALQFCRDQPLVTPTPIGRYASRDERRTAAHRDHRLGVDG